MFLRKVTGQGRRSGGQLGLVAVGAVVASFSFAACSATDTAPPRASNQNPGTGTNDDGMTSGTGSPATGDDGAMPIAPGDTATPGDTPIDGDSPSIPSAGPIPSDTGGTPTSAPTSAPGTQEDPPIFVDEGDDGAVIQPGMEEPQPLPEDQLVEGKVCNSQDVQFTKVIPTVMLVLDRSTSMFATNLANGSSPTPWGEFTDRWEALRAAVSALEPFQNDVQFAGVTYTGFASESNGACPELQGTEIVPAVGNLAAIEALLPTSTEALPAAASETPTAEGIEAGLAVLNAVTTDGPKYLVLITDGLPDLCVGRPELINKGAWCAHDPAYSVVQNAFTSGIKTFVIGIGGPFNDANEEEASHHFLNGLAHAGQGLPVAPNPLEGTQIKDLHCIKQEAEIARGETTPNDFYENWRPYAAATYGEDGMAYEETLYLAPDDATLGPELSKVVAGVRTCSFEMDDNIVRAQAGKGAVRLETPDGTQTDLMFDDPNGWTLDPANDYTVVIQGTACDDVQTKAEIGVKIQFPCEIRLPRVR